jgi:peptidoglycan LD-endopeptidase LytH
MKQIPMPVILLILVLAGCTPYMPEPARPKTRDAGWEEAGRQALRNPRIVDTRYRALARFTADRPGAAAYRLFMYRGQKVTVDLEHRGGDDMIAEVFEEIGPGEPFFRIVHSESARNSVITFEAKTDGPHVVRIRPEAFGYGTVMVSLAKTASLTFPVTGRTMHAINSYFGEARDGGKRDHEGIDIFAPAGTSVVAVAAGVITTVNTTPRGGKVIWQYDAARDVTYYYAHLKTQDVRAGQRVQAGDVIGTVGNTGNAKTTPPHLHFAVYKTGRVAIDPVPFLYDPPGVDQDGPSTKASD